MDGDKLHDTISLFPFFLCWHSMLLCCCSLTGTSMIEGGLAGSLSNCSVYDLLGEWSANHQTSSRPTCVRKNVCLTTLDLAVAQRVYISAVTSTHTHTLIYSQNRMVQRNGLLLYVLMCSFHCFSLAINSGFQESGWLAVDSFSSVLKCSPSPTESVWV